MPAAAPNANGHEPAQSLWLRGPRGLVRLVPAVLVLAGLAATALWGHETGWEFDWGRPKANVPAPAADGGSGPVVQIMPPDPGDPTGTPLFGRHVRIEFGSEAEVEATGIDITPAWPEPLTEQIAAAGEVRFDPTRVARVPARAKGVARRVFNTTGDRVNAGEIVALIDSSEVGKAKGEFQKTLVRMRLFERMRDDLVKARSATSPAAIREAEAEFKDAEVRWLAAAQTLINLGFSLKPAEYRPLSPVEAARRMRLLGLDDLDAQLDDAEASSNFLPVRAPFAGVVLMADVVAGEGVDSGRILFQIVDPGRVWVVLQVGLEDAGRVSVGHSVFFRPDGSAREYPASVHSIGSSADDRTRTVPVRAEADNTAGGLRASTLGRGRIVLREVPRTLLVPHEAVRSFDGRSIVFVRDPDFLKPDGPKAFHVRVVTTGGKDERHIEIIAGLSQGEIVATRGSDRLLSELTKSLAGR